MESESRDLKEGNIDDSVKLASQQSAAILHLTKIEQQRKRKSKNQREYYRRHKQKIKERLPKSNAQRSKEFRERQKNKNKSLKKCVRPESRDRRPNRAGYMKEYRQKVKLKNQIGQLNTLRTPETLTEEHQYGNEPEKTDSQSEFQVSKINYEQRRQEEANDEQQHIKEEFEASHFREYQSSKSGRMSSVHNETCENVQKDNTIEIEVETQQIKMENATDCIFENIEVKHETPDADDSLQQTECTDELNIKIETNYFESESKVDSPPAIDQHDSVCNTTHIKIETEDMNVNSDDIESMDSSDAAALRNVEACLQEDVQVKTENIKHEEYEEHKELCDSIDIKEEFVPSVTETHLISNKLITTTSTVTNPEYGFIGSQTTNTLVMEILPITQSGVSLIPIRQDPEEILSTPFHCKNEPTSHNEVFQLNSITGNVLSLEQEAYGLMTKDIKLYSCSICARQCKSQERLLRHLKVHDSVERRKMGIIKGKITRERNLDKLLETSIEARLKRKINKQKKIRDECKYIKINKLDKEFIKLNPQSKELKRLLQNTVKIEDIKKGTYLCTCGKIFKRKSTLETCLRSHNEVSEASSYSCLTCSRQFYTKNDLCRHRKIKHRKKFSCKFCPTDYNTGKELFRHLQIHQQVQLMEFKVISEVMNGKQTLQCYMCSNTFTDLAELKMHVMKDHSEPYLCKLCKNSFTKIPDFTNHMKTFHPQLGGQSVLDVIDAFSKLVKAWKCEDCNEQFYEAGKLAVHQYNEHSPDPKPEMHFQCPHCLRLFDSQKGLKAHCRIHENQETFEEKVTEQGIMCLECRKMCKDMFHLTSHMRLHSMDSKYPCKYCDFRFATPEKRKEHAEVHTGDMKYVCFICEYQCTSENRLKHHKMSIKHLNMKEFLLTGKPLVEEPIKIKIKDTSKKKVPQKKKTVESVEKTIPCDICGEKFSDEATMLTHKQTHPFIEFPHEDNISRIFFK